MLHTLNTHRHIHTHSPCAIWLAWSHLSWHTHARTHPCTSIFVGAFINIIHSPGLTNPNHPNLRLVFFLKNKTKRKCYILKPVGRGLRLATHFCNDSAIPGAWTCSHFIPPCSPALLSTSPDNLSALKACCASRYQRSGELVALAPRTGWRKH